MPVKQNYRQQIIKNFKKLKQLCLNQQINFIKYRPVNARAT